MTTQDLKSMTHLKRTAHRLLLLNDRDEVVCEWRGVPAQWPASHDDACKIALALMMKRGVVVDDDAMSALAERV